MNKYLKRGAAILLSGAMCLSMAACGDKSESTDSKNSTKTLAQELGYGYLSDYQTLDVDFDWVNSSDICTAQGKLYFAGQTYNDEQGQSVQLFCADPTTGDVTGISKLTMENTEYSSQGLQGFAVSPDGNSYWMLTYNYIYGAAPTEETAELAEAAEESAEATVEETDEALVDTAEAAEETTEAETDSSEETAEESDTDIPTATESSETYVASQYDMSGNLLQEINLTEAVEGDSLDSFYAQYIAQDGEGNLFVASDGKIYCFGADGTKKDTIDLQDQWVMNMRSTGNGTVVVSYYDNNGGGTTLCKVEDGKLGNPISITGDGNPESMQFFSGSGDTLMASDGNYLYSIDLGTGVSSKMLSWLDSDINASYISGVAAVSDEQILVFCNHYSMTGNNDTYELGVLTKTPASEIPERTILTLGAEYLDSNVKDAVVDYNRKSTEYRITLVDYSQYNTEDDYTLGAEQLDRDVVSGNCPDIISLSTGHQDKYIAKGALADLSALLEKDDSISQDDLVAGALKAYTSDGKLYGLPYCFSVHSMIASVKLVGDRTSWTMADMAQVIEGLDDSVSVMDYTTQTSFLQQMVYQNINQFVDYGKATCSFDTDAFQQLLTASAKLPTEEELYGDNDDAAAISVDDTYQQIQSGDVLMTSVYISGDSYSLKEFYGIYNNKDFGMVNIGYPTEEGSGVQLNISSGLAISAKSKYTDAAWDFLKTLLTDDFQEDQWSFPVTKTALDKSLAAAMEQDYYTDENGEKVYYDQTGYIGDTEYTISPLTQEQVDEFKTLVDGASVAGNYDTDIMDIINEEATAFFSGDKTAADVAALIQNRVSIYLGETS